MHGTFLYYILWLAVTQPATLAELHEIGETERIGTWSTTSKVNASLLFKTVELEPFTLLQEVNGRYTMATRGADKPNKNFASDALNISFCDVFNTN